MTTIDNPSLLELKLSALIDMQVGNLFPPHDTVKVVSRDMIQTLLRETLRKALEMYRKDFAEGMRRMLSDIRLRTSVTLEKEQET